MLLPWTIPLIIFFSLLAIFYKNSEVTQSLYTFWQLLLLLIALVYSLILIKTVFLPSKNADVLTEIEKLKITVNLLTVIIYSDMLRSYVRKK